MKKDLILIVGPTASGKTSISINLAKKINAEIISADSMQIYKYMNIGTAKATDSEMENIKHYMMDEILPDQSFTVSDFKKNSYKYIDEIYDRSKIPLVVGGTGLYINSLVYDLDFTESVSNEILRNKLYSLVDKHGKAYVHNLLRKIDKKSYNRIHENDIKRIVRALEIFYETGVPMSDSYNDFRKPNPDFNLIIFGIKMDREKLYDRINERVNAMFDEGLINEVKNLMSLGYDKNLVSMQGLGYKEVIEYLEGKVSLNETIRLIKRDTRRFAKRQLTWFRRDKRINWINVDNYNSKSEIIGYMISIIDKNKIIK